MSSSPAGISCGASCSAAFAGGTSVTLTATPASGSTFASWSGACSGTGTCSVTLDVDRSVTATFNTTVAVPIAPTWLRVNTVSGNGTQLNLIWQDNSNNEDGFKVERKTGCCGPWTRDRDLAGEYDDVSERRADLRRLLRLSRLGVQRGRIVRQDQRSRSDAGLLIRSVSGSGSAKRKKAEQGLQGPKGLQGQQGLARSRLLRP